MTESSTHPGRDFGALAKQLSDLEMQVGLTREASAMFVEPMSSVEVVERTIELARRFCRADAYGVWRRQREQAHWALIASWGLSDGFLANASFDLEGKPVSNPDVAVFSDIEEAPLLEMRRPSLRAEGIRSLCAVSIPVRVAGTVTLTLYWRTPQRLEEADTRLAQLLATQAGAALTMAELSEQSTREFEIVADGVPALISYVDTELRYRRVNRAYERFLGLGKAQLVGRKVVDVLGEEAYSGLAPHLARAVNGESSHFEAPVRNGAGELRQMECSYVPDIGFEGTVRGIVVMVLDVTERNRAEEGLARLAAIVDSSDDAIVSKTLEGIITTWNRGAERIFGYTAAEAVGQNITLIIPEDRLDEEREVLARLRRGERIDHFETVRITKDRRRLHISLTVSPMRDSRGKVIGASKIGRDITANKQLQLRERRSRETAELLNRVGPVLTAELDLERLSQKVTDLATQAVRAQFGALFRNVRNEKGESYSLYTLSGASREAFQNFPMPRNTQVFGPTFRGERAVRSDDITQDPRYGRSAPYHGMPEGHIPVRSYLAVPVVSRNQVVIGGLFFGHPEPGVFGPAEEQIAYGIAAQAAIAMDNAQLFSESQQAQEQLRFSNEELRRVNEDLSQFAHSASHDLQEPLRMIKIYTQLLRRNLDDALDEAGAGYMDHVLRGASRMEALIRDLLAYSQASVAGNEEAPVVDAATALNAALSNLSATIESAGASIVVGALPAVRIRETHLTQIFQNLIGNAIKYTRDEPPRIHISASRSDGAWLFAVEDNGIGIDHVYREQIFGVFKRLHTTDEYSGTGIGLAICQRIVDRAGGRIWVESEPGRGSTFYFTLPATAP